MREADISTIRTKENFSPFIQNKKFAALVLKPDRFLLMREKQ